MRELRPTRRLASSLHSLASALPVRSRSADRPRLAFRLDERSGEGPLGLLLERLLMIANEASGDDSPDHGGDEDRDPHRSRVLLDLAPEPEAAGAKDRSPE